MLQATAKVGLDVGPHIVFVIFTIFLLDERLSTNLNSAEGVGEVLSDRGENKVNYNSKTS